MIMTVSLCIVFHMRRTVDNGAIFNVIVLIGSLIGSVIVAFTMIMQTLEQFCRISTDEPNAPVTGDKFAMAASIEATLTGHLSASGASSRSEKASSKYADFDNDADRQGGDDGADDGAAMGARPFHGNVVIQASECAIEMQQRAPKSTTSDTGVVSLSSHHQNESAADRDSQQQLTSMLTDMRRTMHEQAMRTEAQLAILTAQMARSETDRAALEADLQDKHQLHDQKRQHSVQLFLQLEQLICELRAKAAPESVADDATF